MTTPNPLASIKHQGPHLPTLVYAVAAALAVLGVYHLLHRRR